MSAAPSHLNDLNSRIAWLHEQLKETTDSYERVSQLDELSFHLRHIDSFQGSAIAREQLRIACAIQSKHWMVRSYMRLADCAASRSHYALAQRYFTAAWNLLQELPEEIAEKAYVRRNQGKILHDIGKVGIGMEMLESALELSRQSGDQREIASTLVVISSISINLGLYSKALTLLREAVEIFGARSFVSGIATVALETGRIYALLEDWNGALEHYARGQMLYRQIGNRLAEAQSCMDIGSVYLHQGKFDAALQSYVGAIELSGRVGDTFMHAQSYKEIGRIHMMRGKYKQAFFYLRKAEREFQVLGNRVGKGVILLELGEVFVVRMQWKKALSALTASHEILYGIGFQMYRIRLHKLLAQAYEGNGNLRQSLTHYKLFMKLERALLRDEVRREIIACQFKDRIEGMEHEKNLYRVRIDRLEQEVESYMKEVTSVSLRIAQNDELLDQLRRRLVELTSVNGHTLSAINSIIREIDNRANRVDAWNAFERQLRTLEQEFAHNLTTIYPSLTPAEMRICSLLKINLCNKEIAGLLNISNRTIDAHRRSIRKKMGLKNSENLVAVLARV